jgi:hypothetical protein
MADMLSTAELASMKAEGLRAMPDTAMILRPTIVNGPGGAEQTYPSTGPTTVCRLSASVLSGGSEQLAAGQLVGTMGYSLTVPPGTDIKNSDRILCQGTTFEVISGKRAASWNLSDSYTLTEIQI